MELSEAPRYLRGKGTEKAKGNRRSFDCVTRKCASYFAQDDTLFLGVEGRMG
jgi:hypothetical protein